MSTSSFFIILALLPLHAWCATSAVPSNLNPANLDGLKSQFQAALKSASDVASLHYTIAGNKELGVQSPDSLCNDIKRLTEKSNIESVYHASEAAKALANCKVTPSILPRDSSQHLIRPSVVRRRLPFDDHLDPPVGQELGSRRLLCRACEHQLWSPRRRGSDREAFENTSQDGR